MHAVADVSNSRIHLSLSSPGNLFLPKSQGFKIASLSITSLPKPIDALRVLFDKNPVDVLAINETRLYSSIRDGEMHISNYVLDRRDRSLNGRFGGAVGFYIRESSNYTLCPDLFADQLEKLAIGIRKPRFKAFSHCDLVPTTQLDC